MKAPSLAERLLEDWPAKIVCLVLAFLLFLFYRMSTLDQRYFSVPLTVDTNGEFIPASTYPSMVKIKLRGEADSLYPIQENDISASIDLTRFAAEGEVRVPVRTHLSGSALGIDPLEVDVEPAELILRLEHRVAKKVPVTPDFKGFPETGFELTGYSIQPSEVELSGPRSVMAKIAAVTTEGVDLSGRSSNFTGTSRIADTAPLVSLSGSGRVDYSVAIEPTTYVRAFSSVPIVLESLSQDFESAGDLPEGSLRLRGTNSDLSSFALPFDVLKVDCSNVTAAGVYSLPVTVSAPGRFEVVESVPSEVQLTFRRKAP